MVKISKRMKKLISTNYKLVLLIVLAFLLVMGIIFMLTQGTLSKYTNRSYYSHNVSTGDFIFTSSALSSEGQTHVIYDYDFGNISFDIGNGYINQYTKTDIDYEITCQANQGMCVLAGGTDNLDGSYSTSGTITTGEVTGNTHTFNVLHLENPDGPFVITLTATSTSPYTKTLTATYILYTSGTADYTASRILTRETSEYCEYEIVNNSPKVLDVTTAYQETLGYVTFDESSEFFYNRYYESVSGIYINRIKTALLPYTSQTLRYYKIHTTPQISCSNIVYSIGSSECATPHIRGDVNGDGNVNIIDAEAITNYLNHDASVINGLDACQLQVADHNGDGIITDEDATVLFQYSMFPDLYD